MRGPAFCIDRPGNRPVTVFAFQDDDASLFRGPLSGHGGVDKQKG